MFQKIASWTWLTLALVMEIRLTDDADRKYVILIFITKRQYQFKLENVRIFVSS